MVVSLTESNFYTASDIYVEESSAKIEINCPALGDDCPLHQEIDRLNASLEQLDQQVITDSLTGLYNHRHLMQVLVQEMERTHRSGAPTGIIMLDLDHFKKLNDQYGHEAGNSVLKQLARILMDCTRKLDIACRYGGEEFTVVVPATDLRTCVKIAERICNHVASANFRHEQHEIAMTVSLGVVCYSIYRNETPEQLLQRADQHLYAAKRAGRNRVNHDAITETADIAVSKDEKEAISELFGQQ